MYRENTICLIQNRFKFNILISTIGHMFLKTNWLPLWFSSAGLDCEPKAALAKMVEPHPLLPSSSLISHLSFSLSHPRSPHSLQYLPGEATEMTEVPAAAFCLNKHLQSQ